MNIFQPEIERKDLSQDQEYSLDRIIGHSQVHLSLLSEELNNLPKHIATQFLSDFSNAIDDLLRENPGMEDET